MTYLPGFMAPIVPTMISVSSSTQVLDFPSGREASYVLTLTQNCAITIGAAAAGFDQIITIELVQGGVGGYTPTFTNVSWPGGIAPSFNTAPGKHDMVQVRGVGADVMGWPVSMGRLPLLSSLPPAPASLAVASGANQNSINATAVTSYPAVSGYNIYAGATAGGESAVPIATNVSLPFVDNGLAAGVSRFYKVAAVNSVGVGPMSSEASGTPTATGSIPVAPSSITAVAGNGQVTINVGSVSASPAVTGYTIWRGVSAGGENATPIARNISVPFTDSSVTNNITYFYTAAAVNTIGTGSASREASATPAAPVPVLPSHYATFSTTDSVIYASPSATFNPGSNPFDMQAHVQMANWTSSGYGGSGETCLWGCWDINPANRLWRLGLTANGSVRASWATGASSSLTAVSSAAISTAGGTDLWIRAAVAPVAGAVVFYTSADGVIWNQLGAPQSASGSGGVYTPTTLPYLVIGSNASGGSSGNTAEQFAGRFYEARLYIGSTLVTDPVVGPAGVTDSVGIIYIKTAGVGLN